MEELSHAKMVELAITEDIHTEPETTHVHAEETSLVTTVKKVCKKEFLMIIDGISSKKTYRTEPFKCV